MMSKKLQILFTLVLVFGFNTSVFSEDEKGTLSNPYTVADILAMTDPVNYPTGKQWVEGYCVGAMENAGGSGQLLLSQWFTPNNNGTTLIVGTNIVIADHLYGTGDWAESPQEEDIASIIAVELPDNKVRTALNLIDHPEIFQHKVKIYGNINTYFTIAGVKATTDYVDLDQSVGVVKANNNSFTVYVSNGAITLENTIKSDVTVLNISGQVVYKSSIDKGVSTINISSKGVYVVKVGSEVKKVII